MTTQTADVNCGNSGLMSAVMANQKFGVQPTPIISATSLAVNSPGISLVNATSAAVVVTLPPAASCWDAKNNFGLSYSVLKTDSSVNAVSLKAAGSDTLNGLTAAIGAITQYGLRQATAISATAWLITSSIG